MDKRGSDRPKPPANSRSAGRAKSCTRCRQAKVACDARNNLKGPCSRCKSKNFECRFDANFKRVSTRRLTEEISHEFHVLRSAGEKRGTTDSTSTLHIIPEGGSTAVSKQAKLCWPAAPEDTSPWLNTTKSDATFSYNLGNTLKLNHETVVELFQYFDVNYHPHAMFVKSVESLSELLTRSPLLFWTIIMVASRENDRFAGVYHRVATEHEGLLSTVLGKAIQRIETIHALLLLCLWPVPQPKYFQNPAWNYAGLAAHAAIQLQCHSPLDFGKGQNGWPGFGLVPEGEVDVIDKARTWLGCFRVGTTVATFSGFPPPIATQHHMRLVDEALQSVSDVVPSSWKALFSILKITNSAMDILSAIDDHTLHFSVTQMFSEQLDGLKQVNIASWEAELEVEWCNAKLYILALTFTTPPNVDPVQNTRQRIHRQTILQKAFETASCLITQFMNLSHLSASDLHANGIVKFMPELYFTSLFNATAFVFRFMATSMTLTPTQGSQAMGSLIEAHKIFQSRLDHRECTRAAIHIESLINILKQGAPAGINELVVKNKLGASVMFDAIFHAVRQRNMDPWTDSPLAVQEWKTVNEIFDQRLPKVPERNIGNDFGLSNFASDGLEADQQLIGLADNNPQWWEEWDRYISLLPIDEGQLDVNL